MVAEREPHTYPHSPWLGKGGVDAGGGDVGSVEWLASLL